MSEETTFRLIYRSRIRIAPQQRPAELGKLFTTARSNNKRAGITGALLLSDQRFVQTLEGDEARVRSVFATIERDSRHDEVSVLEAGPVDGRAFPHWAMARVSQDGSAPDTYLIAREASVTPATSRGTSERQEAVLQVMRQAARGPAPVV
ncbi:BLUF domain-containing protein [Blastococcus sp. TF02-09]|uniref:BLUF domain-containing protein n=1 Tax=Blastococcus sp. TF02-09 TaxID=2250576 RepID=UPI0013140B5D|nr:BLUF domain-containing protein [Blastococcus sp. TF02-9]